MSAEASDAGIRFSHRSQAGTVELFLDFRAMGNEIAMSREDDSWTAFLPLDHPDRFVFNYWYSEDGKLGPMQTFVGNQSEGLWEWDSYKGRRSIEHEQLSDERLGIIDRRVIHSRPSGDPRIDALVVSFDGISGPVVEAGLHLGKHVAAVGVSNLHGQERPLEYVRDTERKERLGAFVVDSVLRSSFDRLHLSRPVPVYAYGRSNGGDFALWLALRYPERFAGVIALSPLNALMVIGEDPLTVGPIRPAIYLSWGELERHTSMGSAFNRLIDLGYVIRGGPKPGGHSQVLWCIETLRAMAWLLET